MIEAFPIYSIVIKVVHMLCTDMIGIAWNKGRFDFLSLSKG